jgi:dihydrofolate reductase
MRRIVVTEYLTVDGIFEEPGQWSFDFWSEGTAKFKFDELVATEAMLLGRLTYEGFAAAWPTMKDEAGFADRMNGMPKYVVSTTLTNPSWNNSHVISANVVDEAAKLKDGTGGDILVAGSGTLVQTLMGADLVDEYRFMVHPLVLGKGKRLFRDGIDKSALTLAGTQELGKGVIVLTYHPARTASS